MGQVIRCTRCTDVIGVYEPLVVVDSTGVPHSSLAVEARHPETGDATYHEACYVATQAHSGSDRPDTELGRIDQS